MTLALGLCQILKFLYIRYIVYKKKKSYYEDKTQPETSKFPKVKGATGSWSGSETGDGGASKHRCRCLWACSPSRENRDRTPPSEVKVSVTTSAWLETVKLGFLVLVTEAPLLEEVVLGDLYEVYLAVAEVVTPLHSCILFQPASKSSVPSPFPQFSLRANPNTLKV